MPSLYPPPPSEKGERPPSRPVSAERLSDRLERIGPALPQRRSTANGVAGRALVSCRKKRRYNCRRVSRFELDPRLRRLRNTSPASSEAYSPPPGRSNRGADRRSPADRT